MKNTIFILFMLIASCGLFAQEANVKSLQFSWGLGQIKRQDLTFSPMTHKDWSRMNVALTYHYGESGTSGYYMNFGLDLWMKFDYTFNEENRFNINIGLPPLAYIYRSPYLG